MSIREFTDSNRIEWRVWDVTPAQLHPVTRGEDYMGDLQDGWLVFESAREKRRLEAPYPGAWKSFELPELEALCRRAQPVLTRRPPSTSGQRRAITASEVEQDAETGSGELRTFTSPHGREWTVRIHECLDRDGAAEKVLRFSAGDIVVELREWPDEWQRLTVAEFAMLLLDAEPPRRRKAQGPQRRLDDRAK